LNFLANKTNFLAYTRQDLIVLLNSMYNFKVHLQYSAPNEIEAFEKLSYKLVENISREAECFTLFDLANILSIFRLSKITFNQNIEQNLAIISVFKGNY